MDSCGWGALALFGLIILLMFWLHTGVISPWLVSYFRKQQTAELQERLANQSKATTKIQTQQISRIPNPVQNKQKTSNHVKSSSPAKVQKVPVNKAAQVMKGASSISKKNPISIANKTSSSLKKTLALKKTKK